MAFTVVTWNVLATAYIRPKFYPNTPPRCLDPAWRHPAIVERALSFGADVLCLQEVEESVFATLRSRLAALGYFGELALKEGKPEGCATFMREDRFAVVESQRVVYRDGGDGAHSGHVAHVVAAEHEGARLTVLNTHLKWDPPQTETEQRWSIRETRQALEHLDRSRSAGEIVCGDLNVTPDNEVVRSLHADGFDYAHEGDVRTCNSNGVAKLIDYVFFRGALRATAGRPRAITDATPLPSDEEPSDHLPLVVSFEWAER